RFGTAAEMAAALAEALPPASPAAVGAWVEAHVGETLRERSGILSRIEKTPTSASPISLSHSVVQASQTPTLLSGGASLRRPPRVELPTTRTVTAPAISPPLLLRAAALRTTDLAPDSRPVSAHTLPDLSPPRTPRPGLWIRGAIWLVAASVAAVNFV